MRLLRLQSTYRSSYANVDLLSGRPFHPQSVMRPKLAVERDYNRGLIVSVGRDDVAPHPPKVKRRSGSYRTHHWTYSSMFVSILAPEPYCGGDPSRLPPPTVCISQTFVWCVKSQQTTVTTTYGDGVGARSRPMRAVKSPSAAQPIPPRSQAVGRDEPADQKLFLTDRTSPYHGNWVHHRYV